MECSNNALDCISESEELHILIEAYKNLKRCTDDEHSRNCLQFSYFHHQIIDFDSVYTDLRYISSGPDLLVYSCPHMG